MSGLTPLVLFLLACAMVYIGMIQMAFSTLMRLPLRLSAARGERPDRVGTLGYYLDDPLRLFMPARIVQALTVVLLTVLIMIEFGPLNTTNIAPIVGGMCLSVGSGLTDPRRERHRRARTVKRRTRSRPMPTTGKNVSCCIRLSSSATRLFGR